MVRIMKKDGNRLEGIGERIDVRLTLLEEALGMTPGDPEIYGNWIASKAPEPEVGEEEVGVIEGMDAVEDATTCFPRTEDYQSCPCDRSSFHIVIYHTIILRYSQILNPAPWSEPRIETVGRQGERRRG